MLVETLVRECEDRAASEPRTRVTGAAPRVLRACVALLRVYIPDVASWGWRMFHVERSDWIGRHPRGAPALLGARARPESATGCRVARA